jgi:hypothetical protein
VGKTIARIGNSVHRASCKDLNRVSVCLERGMFMKQVKFLSLTLSLLIFPSLSFAATGTDIVSPSVNTAEESILGLNQVRPVVVTETGLTHSVGTDKDVMWEQGDSSVPVYAPAYLNGSTYSEGWDFLFDFDDGTIISAQIAVSNFGTGKHRMLVLIKLTEPGGREITLKNGRGRSDWSKHEGEFDYQIAQHHFWKDDDIFYFRFSHPSGDIDLVAESMADPLDLGVVWSGGKRGYQYVNIFAPKMAVSGQYRIKDEDTGVVEEYQTLDKGVGHGLRHVTSSAMGEAATAWLRAFATGSSSNNDLNPVVDIRQLKDGKTKANIQLLDSKASVVDDLSFEIEASLLEDSRAECCLLIPINATGSGSLNGTISLNTQVQKFDVVDELKPFERFFVRMFKTPVNTRYRISYDFTYTVNEISAKVTGDGLADLMTLD